jgi:GT2 family glycosyltransferase
VTAARSAGPLVTTIIPTYRRPAWVPRAIRSALDQTLGRVQVRVYDNASGDDTAEAVARVARGDSRVSYYRHPQNIGLFGNFRFGMSRVDTPFFSCLSDDDLLLPQFYELALRAFAEHPDASFVAGVTVAIDVRGRLVGAPMLEWQPGMYYPPDGVLPMLERGHPTWTGILFRREVIDAVGLPEDVVGVASDLDFELKVARRDPFFVTHQPCALFVTHPAAASARKSVDAILAGYGIMRDRLMGDSGLAAPLKDQIARAWEGQVRGVVQTICADALRLGRVQDARQAAELLRTYAGQSFGTKALLVAVSIATLGPLGQGLAGVIARTRSAGRALFRSLRRRLGRRDRALHRSYIDYFRRLCRDTS